MNKSFTVGPAAWIGILEARSWFGNKQFMPVATAKEKIIEVPVLTNLASVSWETRKEPMSTTTGADRQLRTRSKRRGLQRTSS